MAPRRRPLAAADLGALERRTGRARRREHPFPVAEHDLGVGADVHHEADLIPLIGRLGEDDARAIGTHVPRHAREHIHPRPRMELEVECACEQIDRAVDRERERRLAQLHRIQAEQEVVHDRIADHRDVEDLLRRRAALLRRLAEQVPHRGAHRGGHLPLPTGIHHHVRDPAHEVLAESDLRVHRAGRRDHLARREVADMCRDRGRADVDRRAVHPVLQAGPYRDDVAGAVDGDGDPPIAGSQRRLESLEHFEVAAQVREAPLLVQRRLESAQIA